MSTPHLRLGSLERTALLGILLAVALALAACGGDEAVPEPCGDGICASDEGPVSCPLDCSYACAPGRARCSGNQRVVCLDDGLHERVEDCQPGHFCSQGACVEAPPPQPDAGPDAADDVGDGVDDTGDAQDGADDANDGQAPPRKDTGGSLDLFGL
jgi:hypothetical protein